MPPVLSALALALASLSLSSCSLVFSSEAVQNDEDAGDSNETSFTIFPKSADFGIVTEGQASATLSFTAIALSSTDSAPAPTIQDGPFRIVSSDCPSSMLETQECSIEVAFEPEEPGTATGSLAIANGVADLEGAGLAITTEASVAPTAIAFGEVKLGQASAPGLITVTNDSNVELTVAPGLQSAVFSITEDGCSAATLQPDESCTVAVTFTPSDVGTVADSVVLRDLSDGPLLAASSLSGTGTPAEWTLTVFVNAPGGVAIQGEDKFCVNSQSGEIMCTKPIPSGDTIILEASGNQLQGWFGDCSGQQPTCTLLMDSNKTVTAHFLDN